MSCPNEMFHPLHDWNAKGETLWRVRGAMKCGARGHSNLSTLPRTPSHELVAVFTA
jgi:hypothetical protein